MRQKLYAMHYRKADVGEMTPAEAQRIIDSGKTFDFSSYRPPTFPDHWDQGHTRGVGLYLIKQCMDEVTYHQLEDRRNKIRLVKRAT